MTKTEKKYFEKLATDLEGKIIRDGLNELPVETWDEQQTICKPWKEKINPYFERILHNRERGLITYEECFRSMMEAYTTLDIGIIKQ